ncbi:hypothetical protein FACS1894178_7050 [Bacteroidia bacterium]|nr:hypothetical protein FACS1894178_7050 [Bacteroidia bacterium]
MKIDVVITWVDGNVPAHKAKMQKFVKPNEQQADDIAGKTRYASVGEIFYCVASILRFAPFVRKIFIVTDEQNPNLDSFIDKYFPKNTIPIEIIDHKIIFRGYENFLPVFNSLSIETFMWRIPDLSENFIYMNDDCFIMRPISESDWLVDDKIVAVGNWRNILIDRTISNIKPRKNNKRPFGYKDSLMNTADILQIKGRYFYNEHTPMPMHRSDFEHYFSKNPQAFFDNANHKFRHPTQFNLQEFIVLYNSLHKKLIVHSAECFLFINHVKRGESYIQRKIRKFESDKRIKFCCIGSLDLASEKNQKIAFDWLKTVLL